MLAYDEGPRAGLGHRRRVEALAGELEARGWWCSTVALRERSRVGGSLVVVDSYRVRADDRARVSASTVVALDDLRRDLAVDLVVDPSPGAAAHVHRSASRVLAGGQYALVQVGDAAHAAPESPVERVLVTTGAADAAGAGARIADAIAQQVKGVEVRLVLGPWGAHATPDGVVAVHAPDGLAGELRAASIVVTAGGVAMLESCVLGRPTVAVILAENQRQAVCGLAQLGAVAPASVTTAASVVEELVADPSRRTALAASAAAALDGRGAARVADAIEQLVVAS